jgi:septal ring factor EnvC (AmiA/AmiB activator)
MISNPLKKSSPRYTAVVILFFFSYLSSPAVYSQDFSSIDQDLAQLESLINDSLANTQEQQKQLENLKQNLNESGNLIASYENTIKEQEKLLADLRKQLTAMSETYKTQSQLSARYEKNSKFWKTFTIVAIPVTAVISGVVGFALSR